MEIYNTVIKKYSNGIVNWEKGTVIAVSDSKKAELFKDGIIDLTETEKQFLEEKGYLDKKKPKEEKIKNDKI
jgi:protein required for attachment to host cells